MEKEFDIVVVGGGITGLVTAYLASKENKKVAIVESSDKFGGLLQTFAIEGNQLEYYYHHFFTHDAELHWLVKELNLEDKLFYKQTTMGVFRDGNIYDFNSPKDLLKFKPIRWIDKIKFAFSTYYMGKIAKWQNNEHISAWQWLEKFAGKTSTAALWAPLLKIKFGPYAKVIPLSWMVGRMRQRMGSRKKGDEQLGYLQGSLQVLLQALLEKLDSLGVKRISNFKIDKINWNENKEITFLKAGEKSIAAQQYIMTLPGLYLHPLLKNNFPDYTQQLADIKYFGALCVILKMKKALSNIYWLNVAEDNFPFGGVIEHTNFIPPSEYNGKHIAYLSRYFAHEEAIANMDNDEIKKMMLSKLPNIYQAFDENNIEEIFIFKTMTAATVCDLNFSKRVPKFQSPIKNIFIANMMHVYPDERSTNNAIRVAADLCQSMGMNATFVPENKSLSGKIGK